MREPQKGDKIIQRISSTEWEVIHVTATPYELTIELQATRSGRVIVRELSSLTEYRYVDTKQFLIPRIRSNGWTDAEKMHLCKHYYTHGIERLSHKLGREHSAITSQMQRMRQAGLIEKYASM